MKNKSKIYIITSIILVLILINLSSNIISSQINPLPPTPKQTISLENAKVHFAFLGRSNSDPSTFVSPTIFYADNLGNKEQVYKAGFFSNLDHISLVKNLNSPELVFVETGRSLTKTIYFSSKSINRWNTEIVYTSSDPNLDISNPIIISNSQIKIYFTVNNALLQTLSLVECTKTTNTTTWACNAIWSTGNTLPTSKYILDGYSDTNTLTNLPITYLAFNVLNSPYIHNIITLKIDQTSNVIQQSTTPYLNIPINNYPPIDIDTIYHEDSQQVVFTHPSGLYYFISNSNTTQNTTPQLLDNQGTSIVDIGISKPNILWAIYIDNNYNLKASHPLSNSNVIIENSSIIGNSITNLAIADNKEKLYLVYETVPSQQPLQRQIKYKTAELVWPNSIGTSCSSTNFFTCLNTGVYIPTNPNYGSSLSAIL